MNHQLTDPQTGGSLVKELQQTFGKEKEKTCPNSKKGVNFKSALDNGKRGE